MAYVAESITEGGNEGYNHWTAIYNEGLNYLYDLECGITHKKHMYTVTQVRRPISQVAEGGYKLEAQMDIFRSDNIFMFLIKPTK